jgi:glycosyltransferase involved in cell wall biosynthesis
MQTGPSVEYIVCDPGSTDDSRAIIDSYGDQIQHRLYERDKGPADGLNKGFAKAHGQIYGYLNSDDTFLPHAFERVVQYFAANPTVDVVTGHALVIDPDDRVLRTVWSEPFSRLMVAFGASVQIQPSTFIRAEAFHRTSGFNVENRSIWDGELLTDLYLSGSRIKVLDHTLSSYRLHESSITNSGSAEAGRLHAADERFQRLMCRARRPSDRLLGQTLRVWKHLRHPVATLERILRGPIFMRGV